MRSSSLNVLRPPIGTVMAITMLILSFGAPLAAQFSALVPADPNMPVKDGFDTGRAIFWAEPNFTPLTRPRVAVAAGRTPGRQGHRRNDRADVRRRGGKSSCWCRAKWLTTTSLRERLRASHGWSPSE